jgi:hypothetical protein
VQVAIGNELAKELTARNEPIRLSAALWCRSSQLDHAIKAISGSSVGSLAGLKYD